MNVLLINKIIRLIIQINKHVKKLDPIPVYNPVTPPEREVTWSISQKIAAEKEG